MRLLSLIHTLTACIALELKTFKVPLDHFSPISPDGDLEMRYLIETKFFDESDCKLFMILGGEATMNTTHLGSPFVSDTLASEFRAAVVQTEHRFYGESKPENEHLMNRYLSVEQALEDYASLIAYLGSTAVGCERKVVGVFGGSYPGALAGLMRLRYPHLVDFAYASSAPLGFYGGRTNNKYDYYKIVTDEVAKIDPGCPDLVRRTLNHLMSMQVTDLNICDGVETTGDEIVQLVRAFFANRNMANYPPSTGGDVVKRLCDSLRTPNHDENRVKTLIAFLATEQNRNKICYDVLSERPADSNQAICADHSGCGQGSDGRSWDYQACTELVHAIATNGETDMFPPMEFSEYLLEQYCLERFNVRPVYHKLNSLWGIERIDQLVSRVLFVNGARDGWTASAIKNSTHAILIPSGAHHSEMGPERIDDTEDMRGARSGIRGIIREFIGEIRTQWKADVIEPITYEIV